MATDWNFWILLSRGKSLDLADWSCAISSKSVKKPGRSSSANSRIHIRTENSLLKCRIKWSYQVIPVVRVEPFMTSLRVSYFKFIQEILITYSGSEKIKGIYKSCPFKNLIMCFIFRKGSPIADCSPSAKNWFFLKFAKWFGVSFSMVMSRLGTRTVHRSSGPSGTRTFRAVRMRTRAVMSVL